MGFLVFYLGILGTAWALLHVETFYFFWSFALAAVPSYLVTDTVTRKVFNRLDVLIGKYGIIHFISYCEMILSTTVIGALFDVIIRGLIEENVVLVLVAVYPSLVVLVAIYYIKVYRPSRLRAIALEQGTTANKSTVAPARSKPSRQTRADFGTTYAIGCAGIATILGSVSVVEFYRGITIGPGYFPISQAYAGLALAILAFAFTEIEVKEHPRRFITFQALFVAGIALVAPFIQSTRLSVPLLRSW